MAKGAVERECVGKVPPPSERVSLAGERVPLVLLESTAERYTSSFEISRDSKVCYSCEFEYHCQKAQSADKQTSKQKWPTKKTRTLAKISLTRTLSNKTARLRAATPRPMARNLRKTGNHNPAAFSFSFKDSFFYFHRLILKPRGSLDRRRDRGSRLGFGALLAGSNMASLRVRRHFSRARIIERHRSSIERANEPATNCAPRERFFLILLSLFFLFTRGRSCFFLNFVETPAEGTGRAHAGHTKWRPTVTQYLSAIFSSLQFFVLFFFRSFFSFNVSF